MDGSLIAYNCPGKIGTRHDLIAHDRDELPGCFELHAQSDNARFGSKGDIPGLSLDVRLSRESGQPRINEYTP